MHYLVPFLPIVCSTQPTQNQPTHQQQHPPAVQPTPISIYKPTIHTFWQTQDISPPAPYKPSQNVQAMPVYLGSDSDCPPNLVFPSWCATPKHQGLIKLLCFLVGGLWLWGLWGLCHSFSTSMLSPYPCVHSKIEVGAICTLTGWWQIHAFYWPVLTPI